MNSLLNNIPKANYYIVGSDQVFHPKSPYLRAFFFDFPKNDSKKIAYAPSFGMSDFNDGITQKIKPFLIDFDYLSCREQDGAAYLSKVVNKSIPVVLDPIFLLSKQQWLKMAVLPKTKSKYIFIYDLNGGYNLIKIAKKIQKETELKIICQTQTAHRFYKIDKQLYNTGPKEFVGYIANAEYVVTDSFHGTAFSVLFEKKQFIYIARPHASTRIRSIMNIAEISDNIVENKETEKFIFKEAKDANNLNLLKLIEESKSFLKTSLS